MMFNALLAINQTDLSHALELLWKGWLGVFVVIALIAIMVRLIVGSSKKSEK